MKILLTCSNDHPGVKTHFLELQKLTHPNTHFYPIEELVSSYPDYKKINIKIPKVKGILKRVSILKISKELKNFGNNIILGSWRPYYSELINKLCKLNITPSILWCSTLGQSEMTWGIELNPLNEILDLLKKRKIRYLLVPEKTYVSLSHINNVQYLPHPIDISIPSSTDTMELEGNNIDLFFQFRPGKNALQQMLAQRYTKTKFHLHTNIKDKIILDIAKKLNLSFLHHSWLPAKKYYGLVKNMDMSLQVTWTESFNYAVCERMTIGIPTLVSSEVFLISKDKFLKRYLVVETPDSPIAIAQKIDFLFDNKNLMTEIVERSYERITEVAQRYNNEIKDQLKELFD